MCVYLQRRGGRSCAYRRQRSSRLLAQPVARARAARRRALLRLFRVLHRLERGAPDGALLKLLLARLGLGGSARARLAVALRLRGVVAAFLVCWCGAGVWCVWVCVVCVGCVLVRRACLDAVRTHARRHLNLLRLVHATDTGQGQPLTACTLRTWGCATTRRSSC